MKLVIKINAEPEQGAEEELVTNLYFAVCETLDDADCVSAYFENKVIFSQDGKILDMEKMIRKPR